MRITWLQVMWISIISNGAMPRMALRLSGYELNGLEELGVVVSVSFEGRLRRQAAIQPGRYCLAICQASPSRAASVSAGRIKSPGNSSLLPVRTIQVFQGSPLLW